MSAHDATQNNWTQSSYQTQDQHLSQNIHKTFNQSGSRIALRTSVFSSSNDKQLHVYTKMSRSRRKYISDSCSPDWTEINLLKPTGHVMHQQFNIQQLYVLPTLYLCVCIYLRTNSDLCHLQHELIGFYNGDEKCLLRGTNWSLNKAVCA